MVGARGATFVPFDKLGSALSDSQKIANFPAAYGGRVTRDALHEVVDFAGTPFESSLQSLQMGVRDYDPYLGEWTSADPLFFEHPEMCLESPVECNLFSYAANDPVNFTDRNGQIIDALLDAAFIAYDIGSAAWHASTGNTEALKLDVLALGADVAMLAVPGATGGGVAVRSGEHLLYAGSKKAAQAELKAEQVSGRSGAFREAKRDAGIPRSQHPDGKPVSVPLTTRNGQRVLDENGKSIFSREYTFTRSNGSKVVVQDHSAGHKFRENGVGDQGSHFNVRPVDLRGEVVRNGKVPMTKAHYPF
jgi:RHS repeat-associated protein